MFNDITGYPDMLPNQPDTPFDAFGIDWSSDVGVTNPLDNTGSVLVDPTTLAEPNFMFPGLDSAISSNWMAEPSQFSGPSYNAPYFPAPSPLSLSVTEPYPTPAQSPGLSLISAIGAPASSIPFDPSVYASPAPSHISAYSSPVASHGPSTPSSIPLAHSYASPYTSPSHTALVYNPPNKPAPYHPALSSLGPNRVARIKPPAPSKPYLRIPSARVKARPRSSICPLTDPGYDWSALKSPTCWSPSQTIGGSSTQAGWADGAPASPANYPSPDYTTQMAQTAHATAHPVVSSTFSPAPSLHDLQVVTPSAAGDSPAASSPAPSLSYLQVESSPAPRSPSPLSYGFNMDSTGVSSMILATTPTGPIFPALTLKAPSAPPPALVPALPAPAPMPVPAPPTSTDVPTPMTTPVFTPTARPTPRSISVPNPMPISPPAPSYCAPTHTPTTTAAHPINTLTPAPATSMCPPFPESLSAFAAGGPVSATPTSTPSPDSDFAFTPPMDKAATSASGLAIIATHKPAPLPTHNPAQTSTPTPARPPARPSIRPPATRTDTPAPMHNPYVSAPLFTWPTPSTTRTAAHATENATGLGLDLNDEVDRDIALAAGFHLSDTGFQSTERLPEIEIDLSDLSEQSSPVQGQVGRGKQAVRPKMKWKGSRGGELKMHGMREGVDQLVHRWTFSEGPLNPLDPLAMDATGRTEGDVHFSPAPQSQASDPPFVTRVVIRVSETKLQWVEWQEGHPHPVYTGYVFKPAQLVRTKPPQWIRKETWMKAVAKGKRASSSTEEGN